MSKEEESKGRAAQVLREVVMPLMPLLQRRGVLLRENDHMNLEELTPAPWGVNGTTVYRADYEFPEFVANCWPRGGAPVEDGVANAEFIVLARNALDVMMRRGWYARPHNGDARRWEAVNRFFSRGGPMIPDEARIAVDPFTALVSADRWYRENVENPSAPVIIDRTLEQ